jgi:23S rRNA G2069 N7-methylase RlmK/C1962 C5-methylase RlmI
MEYNEKTAAQSELLFNRLSKRYRHLKKWAKRIQTNAFRLYDRDTPEIPLVLDLYGDAVSGAFYKRPVKRLPGEKNELGLRPDESDTRLQLEETWLSAMKAAAARALDISESHIFLKERRRMRHRQDDGSQYGRMAKVSFYRDVIEEDLSFRVNLSDYLDTGLFLDSRKKRALVRSDAAGKRVLNLFAYTCSLSDAAAKGGARQIDSVDLSNTYLEWGRINFALNGLKEGGAVNLIRSDVTRFLAQAAKKGLRWDLIILDPPSFSNSKKTLRAIDLRRDYRQLIDRGLSLLSPGGTLYFSSNARGFRIENADWPGFVVKDITKNLEDEDFIGKRIPVCYTFTKRQE